MLAVHGADSTLTGSAPINFMKKEDEDMQDQRPFDVLVRCSGVHLDPEGSHRHAVLWAYDMENPAAVELVFIPETISRVFARDMLHTAAVNGAPAGGEAADVLIQPSFSKEHGHHLVITLKGPGGEDAEELTEDFILDRRTAQKFLYATFDLVPLGEEDYSVALDAFLHVLRISEGGK